MHDTTSFEARPLLSVDDGIAIIRFNRPEKLNAVNYLTIDALMTFLDLIEVEDSVRVVILTGSGKAFSAGADIVEFAGSVGRGVEAASREFVRRGQTLTRRIENFPKPIIAAVNGIAYGAGCEIMEACHLAIAAEEAGLAKPEINLGFPPPYGGTQRLPRHVGRKRALQMILTGDPISAEEARRIGLVNEVVPAADLMGRALTLAKRVIEKSPLAVSACLASVTRGINLPIDEGLAVEASQFARMVPTRDIQEGIGAFIQKRAAQFTGR
jgi:enoyl-CoA hydratase/carnithine racemase